MPPTGRSGLDAIGDTGDAAASTGDRTLVQILKQISTNTGASGGPSSAVTIQDSLGDSAMDDANDAVRVNVVAGAAGGGAVTIAGTANAGNSSTALLGVGATFTGTGIDVKDYAAVVVTFISDVAAASNGIQLQWSSDNTNWDVVDPFNMAFTGQGQSIVSVVRGRYFRVVYINGGTGQGYFRLNTVLKQVSETPTAQTTQLLDGSGGVKKALIDAGGDADAVQNRLYVDSMPRVYNGTGFDRIRGDIANGVDVDVTRLPALVAGTANIGDVDVLTVPAPLSTAGGGTEATAHRVTIANDSTGVLSVDDNGGSLTVDGPLTDAQLRASAVPVTANAGTNLNTSALALSATQTDGTQKAIARGGVKGATAAADVTSTSQGVDHNALDVADGGGSLTIDATNLDVALSTRLKPADTLTGVTTVTTITNVVHVDDNAGSLTVDGAVTATLAAASDPTKAEDAGHVSGDRGAFILAVRNDVGLADLTSADLDYSPVMVDIKGRPVVRELSQLIATALSGANASVTLTLAAAGAGLFHYITSVEIININPTATAIAGSAVTLSYTSTNIPGSPTWTAGNALAAGAEKVVERIVYPGGIKTTTANTATTIVAPAIGAGGLCRIIVTYYIAP